MKKFHKHILVYVAFLLLTLQCVSSQDILPTNDSLTAHNEIFLSDSDISSIPRRFNNNSKESNSSIHDINNAIYTANTGNVKDVIETVSAAPTALHFKSLTPMTSKTESVKHKNSDTPYEVSTEKMISLMSVLNKNEESEQRENLLKNPVLVNNSMTDGQDLRNTDTHTDNIGEDELSRDYSGYFSNNAGHYYDHFYDYRHSDLSYYDSVPMCFLEKNLCSVSEISKEINLGRIQYRVSDTSDYDFESDDGEQVEMQPEMESHVDSDHNIDLGLKVVCNESVKITRVSNMVDHVCKLRSMEIVVRHQMELCRISRNDLINFINVRSLTITDSALTLIEDGAFALLPRLHTLDLRNNQLLVFSWRTLWRHTALGEHLHHINVCGNPLDMNECQNVWLQTWIAKTPCEDDYKKEGAKEEYVDVEEEAGGMRKEEIQWEDTKKNIIDGNSTKVIQDDCPEHVLPSSTACYLCPANLTVVEGNEDSGVGQCYYILVRCSARGYPLPQIEWDVPDHLVVIKVHEERTDNYTFTSTLNLTFTSIYDDYSYHPLICISQNDRFVSQEQIDLGLQSDLTAPPKICWTKFDGVSIYERFEYVAQVQMPWNLSWWFYPCSGRKNSLKGEDLIHYHLNGTVPHSSYIQGYLKFPNIIGPGKKTGHYELRISNPYGTANVSYYLTQRPTSNPCPKGTPFQFFPQNITFQTFPLPKIPVRPSPPNYPCLSTKSTSENPTTTATTKTTITATTTAATTAATTAVITMTTNTSSLLPLHIILTICVCVVVFAVAVTFVLLRTFLEKRGRHTIDRDPCPGSPFQITFIGCLCRDEDCQKKSDGVQVHEMMPLSADRLVENPEYIGNGSITPSKTHQEAD